ncbi:hypothetical protein BGZ95_003732 [Linnemannia exigua]|uniref:Secreted protein n=1 Tax=Linnemannia exigua TaxID=604196 RepID=A0AAD4H958_9FUNG|nr:hypothetical protein BGZ95_003732 [Linnemannia exigua]
MQFKTLALAAVAVAVVNAQAFEQNECSKCVFGSFSKDATCATLTPAQMTTLQAGFASGKVEPLKIGAAVQDPAIKACLCHWAGSAFTTDGKGAAGSCFTPLTPAPACNSSQIGEATNGIKPLEPILNCAALVKPSTPAGATTTTTAGGPAPTGKSGAVQLNMPYVLSVAALGLAALAGL